MVPYFTLTTLPIGPLQIQVWGVFVALGIGVALIYGRTVARRRHQDPEQFTDFAVRAILGGLVGARLMFAFAYEPTSFMADPWSLFRLWEGGMSMLGGLVGGALAAWWPLRRQTQDFLDLADIAAFVLPLGYAIGRIGCFLIHDHPGTLSHSLLAVQFPKGARLDHGLLLSMAGAAIFALFLAIEYGQGRREKAGAAPGGQRRGRAFLPLFMVCYGAVRLFLDQYRAYDLVASDVRYAGLTPAQYGAILAIIVGLAALLRSRPRPHALVP